MCYNTLKEVIMKSATIHARIQPSLKNKVEIVLEKLGLTVSEAISIYFNQIALQKGIPFDVKVPNKETIKAMKEAKTSSKKKSFNSVSDLMKDLNA
jgi:DNA-damage-inducible protein J